MISDLIEIDSKIVRNIFDNVDLYENHSLDSDDTIQHWLIIDQYIDGIKDKKVDQFKDSLLADLLYKYDNKLDYHTEDYHTYPDYIYYYREYYELEL